MVTVAFVCLGNICRSPMAEAIMRQRLKDRGIESVEVQSRGTCLLYTSPSPRDRG